MYQRVVRGVRESSEQHTMMNASSPGDPPPPDRERIAIHVSCVQQLPYLKYVPGNKLALKSVRSP